MKRALIRLSIAAAWLSLSAAACTSTKPVERPVPPVVRDVRPPPVRPSPLYGAEDALRDVLAGELEYIGTGRWPGIQRSRACAFRNQRVVVVNAYCTLNEVPAFRIDVYSPERGRVRIYAEAAGAISVRDRDDYFTFMVETGQPPSKEARIAPLTLSMHYEQLRQYEQQRYDAFLPGCSGGMQHHRDVGGCLGALQPRRGEWVTQNQAFLQRANADWYSVIQKMRALAARYGEHPKK